MESGKKEASEESAATLRAKVASAVQGKNLCAFMRELGLPANHSTHQLQSFRGGLVRIAQRHLADEMPGDFLKEAVAHLGKASTKTPGAGKRIARSISAVAALWPDATGEWLRMVGDVLERSDPPGIFAHTEGAVGLVTGILRSGYAIEEYGGPESRKKDLRLKIAELLGQTLLSLEVGVRLDSQSGSLALRTLRCYRRTGAEDALLDDLIKSARGYVRQLLCVPSQRQERMIGMQKLVFSSVGPFPSSPVGGELLEALMVEAMKNTGQEKKLELLRDPEFYSTR